MRPQPCQAIGRMAPRGAKPKGRLAGLPHAVHEARSSVFDIPLGRARVPAVHWKGFLWIFVAAQFVEPKGGRSEVLARSRQQEEAEQWQRVPPRSLQHQRSSTARRIAGDAEPAGAKPHTLPPSPSDDPNQNRGGKHLLYGKRRTQAPWNSGYPARSPPPTVAMWRGTCVPQQRRARQAALLERGLGT